VPVARSERRLLVPTWCDVHRPQRGTRAKAGITASRFPDLTSAAQELYIAGITDALDEADLLHCPAGTSYRQVISLTEAYVYKIRERAGEIYAAKAVMQALKDSGCSGKPARTPARPRGS
jgi:hypothetical protein